MPSLPWSISLMSNEGKAGKNHSGSFRSSCHVTLHALIPLAAQAHPSLIQGLPRHPSYSLGFLAVNSVRSRRALLWLSLCSLPLFPNIPSPEGRLASLSFLSSTMQVLSSRMNELSPLYNQMLLFQQESTGFGVRKTFSLYGKIRLGPRELAIGLKLHTSSLSRLRV